MIFDLLYFEVVIRLVCGAYFNQYKISPYDYMYNCLNFKMMALKRDSDDFKIIEQYVTNGLDSSLHDMSLLGYHTVDSKMKLSNIYAVERKGEKQKFEDYLNSRPNINKNSMLLWHGTKASNVIGILQTGFRIAPSNVNRTGAMFGDGVYFADRFAKSYQYTDDSNGQWDNSNSKEDYRYMLLCEVILGNCKDVHEIKDFSKEPEISSIKGVGSVGPDSKQNIYLPNGCIVPIGENVSKDSIGNSSSKKPVNPGFSQTRSVLSFNEYVVYDTSQIMIRYIVEIKNDAKENSY